MVSISNNIISDEMNEIETSRLFKNAYLYGFILRYPKGKEDITCCLYEQWHYRYVDKELSMILNDNNFALNEYHLSHEKVLKNRH